MPAAIYLLAEIFVTAAIFLLAGIFVPAANYVLAGIFVQAANFNVLQQTACLVVNPITVGSLAFLFNCTLVGRTLDSMMVPT